MERDDVVELAKKLTAPFKTIAFWILFFLCVQNFLLGALLALVYLNR